MTFIKIRDPSLNLGEGAPNIGDPSPSKYLVIILVNNDKGVFLEERGKCNSVERVTIVCVPKKEKFFGIFPQKMHLK